MVKFSQMGRASRLNEQEITLPGTDSATNVKVEIHSTDGKSAGMEKSGDPSEGSVQQAGGNEHVVKFFSKIFESREMSHVYHLTVKGEEGSHAKHLALKEFYEGVIGMLDDLIEVYQGEHNIIEGYDSIDTSATRSTETIKYFEDLATFIKEERHKCFSQDQTHYFNIIDDILVLTYKTLYKLKYNK